jgi:hypothetical protein
MCTHHHHSDSPVSSDVLDAVEADQKAWSLVARMANGSEQRFSAGVIRSDDDGRLVVSLLNHDHADVRVVQWLGSDDPEDPSYDLAYAVDYVERVVSEYERPVTIVDQIADRLGLRPVFFQRADEAYPGFEPVDPDDGDEPTPEGFGLGEA